MIGPIHHGCLPFTNVAANSKSVYIDEAPRGTEQTYENPKVIAHYRRTGRVGEKRGDQEISMKSIKFEESKRVNYESDFGRV